MNEMTVLPTLLEAVSNQDFADFQLFVCVNQVDEWWDMPEKVVQCVDNQQALGLLRSVRNFPVTIIDRSSRGKGWIKKDHGVGWARKTLMDAIAQLAGPDDLIISLDADTVFGSGYLTSLLETFNTYQDAVGMAVPYYHKLVDEPEANRAMLRYEIYMRNYAINLWRINCPYAFTALGSAMVVPVWAYKAISGMTPKKSGEDFYFLQKLRKYGKMLVWNREKVYPGTRFSDRVFFGTGPAMIKGRAGDWESYPIYHHSLFDHIKTTYDQFESLYADPEEDTPLNPFLRQIFNDVNIWEPLKKNSKSAEQFIRACHHKFDGLRILQYLKASQSGLEKSDISCLKENISSLFPTVDFGISGRDLELLSFEGSSLDVLNSLRDFLVLQEEKYQQSAIIH